MMNLVYQLVGDWYVKQINRRKMPTLDNFVQKGEYILPFTGKWTVFNGGVDENLWHGGSVSQIYAYDFIIMDDDGKSFKGNATDLNSYYCYAKDIISPADGMVVQVRKKSKNSFVDGINVYCNSADIRGNYVIIKHHENEYSMSAHLMPGSIKVTVGDKVKQGEVIAMCGNSGNTSEPHLHFQFQSGKNFFLSAGLPIAFSGIRTNNKTNYKLADSRPNKNNLQAIGDRTYIGRGLEVMNENIKTDFPPGFAIAIDGTMGVGKSTVAKLLAQMLGITYIDTGAMYRVVALYSIQNSLTSPAEIENSLQHIDIGLRHVNGAQRVFLNGHDVTELIRTQEISDVTSKSVAVNEAVRQKLVAQQREMAKTGAVVMDGRDIGSQVLPNAQVKIYLDASPQIRARRRTLELESKGQPADYETVLEETILRDKRDKTREISPLIQTPDAIYIDTGHMNPQEVAEKIAEHVKEAL